MQLIENLSLFPETLRGGVVSIGKFDGLHLGHALILDQVRANADRLGVPGIAVTFDPLPGTLLFPNSARPPLCTLEQKAERIGSRRLDGLLILKTSRAFLTILPEIFFGKILLDILGMKMMVEGTSFTFGADRAGTVDMLRELCIKNSIPLEVVPPVCIDGREISSSMIRKLLSEGEIPEANTMLGSPYSVSGTVAHGDRRGRTLGFPTANLVNLETMLPKPGIYATVAIFDGKRHPAATHLGPNPTFGVEEQRLEVNVLDFKGDLYGKKLELEFHSRLRDIITFENSTALIQQMNRDIEQIRDLQ